MNTRPCAGCTTPTDASYGLCPACLRDRVVGERAEQGLGPVATSATVYRSIAVLMQTASKAAA